MRKSENKKQRGAAVPLCFLDLFVHGTRFVLANGLNYLQDFNSHRPGAHGNLNPVTRFYFVAGLYHPTVDADAPIIAGFVGDGPPLDQT